MSTAQVLQFVLTTVVFSAVYVVGLRAGRGLRRHETKCAFAIFQCEIEVHRQWRLRQAAHILNLQSHLTKRNATIGRLRSELRQARSLLREARETLLEAHRVFGNDEDGGAQ